MKAKNDLHEQERIGPQRFHLANWGVAGYVAMGLALGQTFLLGLRIFTEGPGADGLHTQLLSIMVLAFFAAGIAIAKIMTRSEPVQSESNEDISHLTVERRDEEKTITLGDGVSLYIVDASEESDGKYH